MTKTVLKVLLVDDHYIVRAGMRELLQEYPTIQVAAEADTGKEALNLVKSKDLNLVMLDFNLPDIGGIELLREIKKYKPSLPVLMFSSFSEDEFALACVRAGAGGYITKDAKPEAIHDAAQKVASGYRWLSNAMTEKLINDEKPSKQNPHDTLICREFDVLIGISRGESLKSIGERLNLSIKTISTHRFKILVKLDVKSNAEITKYVINNRLDEEYSK